MDSLGSFFSGTFGGFLVAIIILLILYSAIGIWAPQYSSAFALVTALGILMFWLSKKG